MKGRAKYASLCLLSLLLVACGPPPATGSAKKVGKEDVDIDPNAPKSLGETKFVESSAGGDPATVGCADGQREGFADLSKYPTIAGCMGVWEGEMTLRKGQTSVPCGDDGELCGSPADVCSPGWHVCARDGDYHDLSDRVSDKDCSEGAGPGRFNAAISHVKKKKECPEAPGPTVRYPCLKQGWGAEPVCCGAGCKPGKCRDGVWSGQTKISKGTSQGCGAVGSERNGGVLCCKDSDKPKATIVPMATPPTAPSDGTTPPDPTLGGPATAPTGDPTGSESKKTGEKQASEQTRDHARPTEE